MRRSVRLSCGGGRGCRSGVGEGARARSSERRRFPNQFCGARTFVWIFAQHSHAHALQLVAVCVRKLGRLPVLNLSHQPFHRLGAERLSQRHHLVQDASHGPHIGFMAIWRLSQHLGGHEDRGADERLRRNLVELKLPGDAKISQSDSAPTPGPPVPRRQVVAPEEYILAFQVPV